MCVYTNIYLYMPFKLQALGKYVYACIYIYIYVYVCVCVYIYKDMPICRLIHRLKTKQGYKVYVVLKGLPNSGSMMMRIANFGGCISQKGPCSYRVFSLAL